MAMNQALVLLLHACLYSMSWALPIDEAKQTSYLSFKIIDKYILSRMPGIDKSSSEITEIYDLIKGNLAEVASVYTTIETELAINEESVSDELVAISHAMKHTLEATCTWIKSLPFIDDEFECSPESLLLHKYREPVYQLKETLKTIPSSSTTTPRFCNYLRTKFNCDQNIPDAIKEIVHSFVDKNYCNDPTAANCE